MGALLGQTAQGASATAPEAFYSSRPPSSIPGGGDSYYDARFDTMAPSYLPGGGDAFYDTTWDEALPRNDIPNHQATADELASNQASYELLREERDTAAWQNKSKREFNGLIRERSEEMKQAALRATQLCTAPAGTNADTGFTGPNRDSIMFNSGTKPALGYMNADGSTTLANGQRVPSLSAGDGSVFEARRAAFQQRMATMFMSPIGSGAYAVTHFAGGSQGAQDLALSIGAGIEGTMALGAGVSSLRGRPNPLLQLERNSQAPIRDLRNNLVLDSKGNPLVVNRTGGTLVEVNPATDLRYTQRTAGGNGRADQWRQRFDEGNYGPPIEVVRTSDGLVSVDHTRAAVAVEKGVNKLNARVYEASDTLPQNMIDQKRFGDATTWGEAAAYRAANQRPPLPPTGTQIIPKLPKPRN